jgi:hypothetical protein
VRDGIGIGSKIFDRSISVLALIASVIAAYYAFRTYRHDFQPEISFTFYIANGDKEIFADAIQYDSSKLKPNNGFMEVIIPIKILNSGEADANKLTLLIGPQANDNQKLELVENGCLGWRIQKVGQQDWYTRALEHMPPESSMTDNCFRLRVKEGIKEIKLSWKILASRTSPKKGDLGINFK